MLVPRAGVEPARDCSRGILSPLRLPVSPPGQLHTIPVGWRLGPESNRRTRLCRPLHNHSATQPINIKKATKGRFCLERETRFELATPTLARLCSTTELFPHLNEGNFTRNNVGVNSFRLFFSEVLAMQSLNMQP